MIVKKLALYAAVFGVFLAYFAYHYTEEPYFIDEGAYLAQSYYYRLMKEGKINDVDWLHLAAYDYPNIGRSIVGFSLDLQGYELPQSIEGMEAWYGAEQEKADYSAPEDLSRLYAARWAMLIGGAFGCLAMFALVKQFIGPMTGLLAATLLAASPLYYTLSRRAMADVWVAAFELAGLALLMHVGHRLPLVGKKYLFIVGPPIAIGAGILLGLSAGTKLNGAIAICALAIGTGLILAICAPWRSIGPTHFAAKRLGFITVLAIISATLTFFIEHPFFYANPTLPAPSSDFAVLVDGKNRSQVWIDEDVRPLAAKNPYRRLEHMFNYREAVLQEMLTKNRFPEASLPTITDRWNAILVQGLGRWSFAGRLPLTPQGAAVVASILILLGVWWSLAEGRRRWKMGMLPLTWIFVTWLVTEVVVLSRELTLDWDRYYLDVVVLVALFTALGIGGTLQWINQQLVLLPPESPAPPDATHA